MKYQLLPYEFSLSAWLYWIESLEFLPFRPSFVLPMQLKPLLEYVRDRWDYWRDQRFFRTTALILLTGCRISEIPTIGYGSTPDGMILHLYAKKQKVERYLEFTHKAAEKVGLNNFHKGILTLGEKEYNRRFMRYFPTLKVIARNVNIKSGSHIFRHLFVSTLIGVSSRTSENVKNIMKWSDDKLVLDYSVLLRI